MAKQGANANIRLLASRNAMHRSEVGGVYFNALFCGRRSKRTFNGVRLAINLAVEHNRALETGVWELWITVEPAVHRFSPVDW